jgi:hypothetical protein
MKIANLLPCFKKKKISLKLNIHGIYVEFDLDLFCTINLLEAAPSVEIFDAEVFLVVPFRFFTATGTMLFPI